MKLDNVQKKIIQSKPLENLTIKGGKGTGKTLTAIHRMLYLKNNYCIYDTDKILFVVNNADEKDSSINLYERLDKENKLEYFTLFSNNNNKIEFVHIDELINKYIEEYLLRNKLKVIDESSKTHMILKCIKELQGQKTAARIINTDKLIFLKDEIEWMKACKCTDIFEYQKVQRKGRGTPRILKDSKDRDAIHQLLNMYNANLEKNKFMDLFDLDNLMILEGNKAYTHIIVDNAEALTKSQIDLIGSLSKKDRYSSLMLFANQNNAVKNSWIIRGRKLETKSITLKNVYQDDKTTFQKKTVCLESFKYHDIKHSKVHDFSKDPSNSSELIVSYAGQDDVLERNELRELPVFNDIAAGEPIYINDEIEDTFKVPVYWIKGMKNCFILKVKGDSMINAQIEDGDMVVINQQQSAQHNDIVAVNIDGNATLKRLNIQKDKVLLMPENENYKPIPITEEGATIIGIAAGIIKHTNH